MADGTEKAAFFTDEFKQKLVELIESVQKSTSTVDIFHIIKIEGPTNMTMLKILSVLKRCDVPIHLVPTKTMLIGTLTTYFLSVKVKLESKLNPVVDDHTQDLLNQIATLEKTKQSLLAKLTTPMTSFDESCHNMMLLVNKIKQDPNIGLYAFIDVLDVFDGHSICCWLRTVAFKTENYQEILDQCDIFDIHKQIHQIDNQIIILKKQCSADLRDQLNFFSVEDAKLLAELKKIF